MHEAAFPAAALFAPVPALLFAPALALLFAALLLPAVALPPLLALPAPPAWALPCAVAPDELAASHWSVRLSVCDATFSFYPERTFLRSALGCAQSLISSIGSIGTSVELLVTAACQSSAQVHEGVTLHLEWALCVARVLDGCGCNATEGAGESLEVASLAACWSAKGGGEEGESKDRGLHIGWKSVLMEVHKVGYKAVKINWM